MKRQLAAITAAVLASIASPGFAASSASASFSDITFTLFDLTPLDGIDPMLSFASGVGLGSRVETEVKESNAFGEASASAFGYGSTVSTSVNRQSVITGGSASAALTGSGNSVIQGAGANDSFINSMAASGSTSGPLDGPGSGSFSAAAATPAFFGTFTLSGNTLLVVSAMANVFASTTVGLVPLTGSSEFANATASLNLSGTGAGGGGSQQTSDMANVFAAFTFDGTHGNGQTWTATRQMAASFTNFTADEMQGKLNLGVLVNGNSNIAAIPEPETYAMMLAGLGVVGFMARRRKVRQA